MARPKVLELPIRTTVDEAVADPAVEALIGAGFEVVYVWSKEMLDGETGEVTGTALCMLFTPVGPAAPVATQLHSLDRLGRQLRTILGGILIWSVGAWVLALYVALQ